jgi:hypothetical protein
MKIKIVEKGYEVTLLKLNISSPMIQLALSGTAKANTSEEDTIFLIESGAV